MKKGRKDKRERSPNRRGLFLAALFVLSVFALSPANGAAQTPGADDWTGSYYFTDTAAAPKRRKFTDVAPSASYDVTIERNGNKLVATFSAYGVQLAEAYECSVEVANNKAEFHFQNLAARGAENFRKYKKGDLLFAIVKIQTAKATKYLFQPSAYKIIRASAAKQKQPVYFEKP